MEKKEPTPEFKKAIKPVTEETASPSDTPITDYEGTVQTFRASYKAIGKPRILLYINRSLVKDRGELLTKGEVTGSIKTKGDPIATGNSSTVQIGTDNKVSSNTAPTPSGKGGERQENVSLSERVYDSSSAGVSPVSDLEARQIEEAFQRPFFDAGARFIDQKIARLALQSFSDAGESFLTPTKSDKEREEVEALRKSSDLVIEILARRKPVSILQASGNDKTEWRLELTATAMNLKDGTKLAQVNSESLFGFNRRHGAQKERQARQVTSNEIIEQVALKLMQQLEP